MSDEDAPDAGPATESDGAGADSETDTEHDGYATDSGSLPGGDADATDAGSDTGSDGDDTVGTEAAIAAVLDRAVTSERGIAVSLVLAVVWWLAFGAASAVVAWIGLLYFPAGASDALTSLASTRWSRAEAVVVESDVLTKGEAREYVGRGGSDSDTSGRYVPLVRYEYTVEGTRYENARISPFDGMVPRRRWAEAIVARYPRGEYVSVRYDPDDPTRSYLQWWIRSSYLLVWVAAPSMFLGVAAWIAAGFPGGPAFVPLGVGVPFAAAGLYGLVRGRGAHRWPTTTAVVEATDVSVGSSTSGEVRFSPEIRYEYEVDGTTYANSRYAFGGTPTFDSRSGAESWVDQFPVGGEVTVHYDPDRPDVSVVEPGSRRSLYLLAIGLVGIGLGLYILPGASVPTDVADWIDRILEVTG